MKLRCSEKIVRAHQRSVELQHSCGGNPRNSKNPNFVKMYKKVYDSNGITSFTPKTFLKISGEPHTQTPKIPTPAPLGPSVHVLHGYLSLALCSKMSLSPLQSIIICCQLDWNVKCLIKMSTVQHHCHISSSSYHARCTPDVRRRTISSTKQHLQTPILARLYVLREMMKLHPTMH